jgi:hypothetical protein
MDVGDFFQREAKEAWPAKVPRRTDSTEGRRGRNQFSCLSGFACDCPAS